LKLFHPLMRLAARPVNLAFFSRRKSVGKRNKHLSQTLTAHSTMPRRWEVFTGCHTTLHASCPRQKMRRCLIWTVTVRSLIQDVIINQRSWALVLGLRVKVGYFLQCVIYSNLLVYCRARYQACKNVNNSGGISGLRPWFIVNVKNTLAMMGGEEPLAKGEPDSPRTSRVRVHFYRVSCCPLIRLIGCTKEV